MLNLVTYKPYIHRLEDTDCGTSVRSTSYEIINCSVQLNLFI